MSLEQLRHSAQDFNAGIRRFDFEPPATAEIAAFYEANGPALTEIYGGQVHVGYWTGPGDEGGVAAACARLTALMADALGVGPGRRVLDLGCGSGAATIQVARSTGAEVVGVSIGKGEIEAATALAEAEGMAGRVRFVHGDALDLDAEPGSFDAVIAIESFVHFPDRVPALRGIRRVLRPGGRVVFTDYVRRGPDRLGEEEEYALAEMSALLRMVPMTRAEHYAGFVRQAGLEPDRVSDITEHTKYSFARVYVEAGEYRRRHGALPPDLEEIFGRGTAEDWLETVRDTQYDGVVLVSARRPAA
ncbi:SAM-dependent methyltransferase [Nonomuraea sp. NPDC002799]